MATTKQVEMSLLTEHLRYTPLTLLDDIINAVNEIAFRLVNAAEQGLLSADPANLGFAQAAKAQNIVTETDTDGKPIYPEAKAEIEEGVHKLETLLESNVDKNFDKLELYVLRGPLHVPPELVPWVRLGHYEKLNLPTPGSLTSIPTPESVQELRSRLQETRKLHLALRAAAKRNRADLEQLRSLIPHSTSALPNGQSSSPGLSHEFSGSFAFLAQSNGAKALGVAPRNSDTSLKHPITSPLETNSAFTLSQLPALRALLDHLRPKLAKFTSSSGGASEDEATRERRMYIENQTKKALERRGVDFSQAGAIGRRIAVEELAALETITESMGGGSRMEE